MRLKAFFKPKKKQNERTRLFIQAQNGSAFFG